MTALLRSELLKVRTTRLVVGLLAATVDMARQDGLVNLVTWVPENDLAARTFFGSAGWEEAGWIRTLDADGSPLREIFLHTSIEQDADPGRPA